MPINVNLLIKVLDFDIVGSKFELRWVKTFIFEFVPFGEEMNLLFLQTMIKSYHYYSSTKVDSALNNTLCLICH